MASFSVCLSARTKTAVGPSKKRLHACRGEPRNQLHGLKEGGQAMRGAMLCLSADLTTHAVYNFSPCRMRKWAGAREWRRSAAKDEMDDGVKVLSAAKYGSVKVFIVAQERRV